MRKSKRFIEQLMDYEHGKLSRKEDYAFLHKVQKGGFVGSLQGHYGRAIANMNAEERKTKSSAYKKTLRANRIKALSRKYRVKRQKYSGGGFISYI